MLIMNAVALAIPNFGPPAPPVPVRSADACCLLSRPALCVWKARPSPSRSTSLLFYICLSALAKVLQAANIWEVPPERMPPLRGYAPGRYIYKSRHLQQFCPYKANAIQQKRVCNTQKRFCYTQLIAFSYSEQKWIHLSRKLTHRQPRAKVRNSKVPLPSACKRSGEG